MKKSEFVEAFKLKKALGDYKVDFKKGDLVTMFNNDYEVISSQENTQVLLKDMKSVCFSFPLDKLQLLMKKGVIHRKQNSIQKAFVGKMRNLIKGGKVKQEGSRGGTIIGHQKDNTPIYMNHNITSSTPHHMNDHQGNEVKVKSFLQSNPEHVNTLAHYDEQNAKISEHVSKESREAVRHSLDAVTKHMVHGSNLIKQHESNPSPKLKNQITEQKANVAKEVATFNKKFKQAMREKNGLSTDKKPVATKIEPVHPPQLDPIKQAGLDKMNRKQIAEYLKKKGYTKDPKSKK